MRNKIIIIIASTVVVTAAIAALVVAYLNIANLKSQIRQTKSMLQMTQDKAAALAADKEKIEQENEKLQADAVSYLGINTKLQTEKEKLQKSVEEAQKVIENKESSLQRAKSRLDEIEKGIAVKTSKEREDLIKEKKALTKKTAGLSSTLKKERALYHYNLGVAYANAKLYDEALDEYKKSLEEKGDNAEAYYNMALIYDSVFKDTQNAILQYKKYLELKPDAEDRDEVEAAIEKLK